MERNGIPKITLSFDKFLNQTVNVSEMTDVAECTRIIGIHSELINLAQLIQKINKQITSTNPEVADFQYRIRQNAKMAKFLLLGFDECIRAIRTEANMAAKILADEYAEAMAAKIEAERIANKNEKAMWLAKQSK